MSVETLDRWLIDSLMDTDLYKITMLQAYYHTTQFRTVDVEWKFACRNRNNFDLAILIPQIRRQLEHVCTLSFTEQELDYLSHFPFIKADFIAFLRILKVDMRYVHLHPQGEDLNLRFRGPLLHVALLEIYALAIISELHTFAHCAGIDLVLARQKLNAKIALLKAEDDLPGFSFIDFGTRRRASKAWQEEVLITLKEQIPEYFAGTSSLHFARTLDLQPVGTMAHEWLQCWQAVTRLGDAQKAALEAGCRNIEDAWGLP